MVRDLTKEKKLKKKFKVEISPNFSPETIVAIFTKLEELEERIEELEK
jgi:hypothetical protein